MFDDACEMILHFVDVFFRSESFDEKKVAENALLAVVEEDDAEDVLIRVISEMHSEYSVYIGLLLIVRLLKGGRARDIERITVFFGQIYSGITEIGSDAILRQFFYALAESRWLIGRDLLDLQGIESSHLTIYMESVIDVLLENQKVLLPFRQQILDRCVEILALMPASDEKFMFMRKSFDVSVDFVPYSPFIDEILDAAQSNRFSDSLKCVIYCVLETTPPDRDVRDRHFIDAVIRAASCLLLHEMDTEFLQCVLDFPSYFVFAQNTRINIPLEMFITNCDADDDETFNIVETMCYSMAYDPHFNISAFNDLCFLVYELLKESKSLRKYESILRLLGECFEDFFSFIFDESKVEDVFVVFFSACCLPNSHIYATILTNIHLFSPDVQIQVIYFIGSFSTTQFAQEATLLLPYLYEYPFQIADALTQSLIKGNFSLLEPFQPFIAFYEGLLRECSASDSLPINLFLTEVSSIHPNGDDLLHLVSSCLLEFLQVSLESGSDTKQSFLSYIELFTRRCRIVPPFFLQFIDELYYRENSNFIEELRNLVN